MSGVGCERKHDVRDDMCLGVQNSKAAGVEAELCNEEGVMREGRDTDGVGDEAGNDVVHSCREGTIPISPIERGCVRVVVVEDVAPQEVGYLLDEGVVV